MGSTNLADLPVPPDSILAVKDLPAPPDSIAGKNPTESAPGQLESLARGAIQGGSFGFSDEIGGAGQALLDAASAHRQGAMAPGQIEKAAMLTPPGIPGTLSEAGANLVLGNTSIPEIVKNYIRHRDDLRRGDLNAQKANPKTYMGGQLAGGIAGASLVPIGGIGSLGGRALAAGGLGAASALGSSHADLTQGQIAPAVKDTALGFATGAILQPAIEGLVGPAVGYVGNKLGQLGSKIGKKALATGFDIPEGVSTRYLNDPEAVNNALSKEGVAQKLADTLGDVRNDTGPATEAALSTLSTERSAGGMPVKDAIDLLSKYNDPSAKALAERLGEEYSTRSSGGLLGNQEPNSGMLTEREMHDVKKTLQGLTDWKKPLPTAEQASARLASGDINQTLKAENNDYQSAMGDLAQNIQSKKELASKFAIQPDYTGNNESGFTFTDRTVSALKDLVNGNKFDRAKVLDGLKQQGYGDLAEDIQNTLANEKLNGGGIPNGSRKTLLFGTLGGLAGHATHVPGAEWSGSAIGAATGATLDKFGPQIGKKALDASIMIQRLSASPGGQKFIGAIQNAATKGPSAVAATHFILSQTEPAYQEAMSGGQ